MPEIFNSGMVEYKPNANEQIREYFMEYSIIDINHWQ